MPRISYLNTKSSKIAEATKRCEKLSHILKGYTNAAQVAGSELVDLKESTARKRLCSPQTMTLQELVQVCIAFDIPCEDVVSKIRW